MIRPRRKPLHLQYFYSFALLTGLLFHSITCHAQLATKTGKLQVSNNTNDNDITHPPVSVIFPCSADKPIYCPSSSKLYTTCGNDRYCAPDPSSNTLTQTPLCLHKDLSPPSWRDIVVISLIVICCFVAAMGGIGGGGLLLPIAIIGMNFLPKQAAVMSNAGVFGNTLGQLLVNSLPGGEKLHAPHEVTGTVLMIMPGLLAGGSIAITFVDLVPATVVLILAFVTLASACTKTLLKARGMSREEAKNKEVEGKQEKKEKEEGMSYCSIATHQTRQGGDSERSTITVSETIMSLPPCPYSKINSFISRYSIELVTLACWSVGASIFLLIEEGSAIGISKCSPIYFIMVFAPALSAVIFTCWGRREIKRHSDNFDSSFHKYNDTKHLFQAGNDAEKYPLISKSHDLQTFLFTNQETQYPFTNPSPPASKTFDNLVWWLPPLSLLIGIICALLGIGGGELLGPTLLLLRMDPQVSSATTATLSLLNSGTNALHHSVTGMVTSYTYTRAIGMAGFIGGGMGRMTALWIAGKGRRSVIAYSLGVVLLVATVLVGYELISTEPDWRNKSTCPSLPNES